ncbi:P2Y purinoceptor 14-like [Thunnus albacares]|uniref:P2Y purinoceptor 14-like n=1 Tax=Thunnus albacares TaxID=8236 RepID=UPI001CF63803|nr:P2Y purinoceptor 14-like [Thunnus albacares]
MDDLVGMGVTSVTNQTYDDNMTHCDPVDTSVHLFLMPVYTLVFLVGLVLNSFLVKVYFCSAQQQVSSIMVVYLKNLAASDFVLCLCLPLNIANYTSNSATFRLVYCIFGASTFYLNIYASILFMGYIAANRYLKIIHPLRTHVLQTVQVARIISTVTWVFLLAITTSYITLFLLTQPELTIVPDICDPLQSAKVIVFDKIIHTCSTVTFLFVLVSLVFFYYSASRSVLLAQQRQLSSTSCKRLKKSRRKMLVLVSVFCICFVPYHLVSLPYIFLKRMCSLSQVLYYLKELTMLLSVVNICLDPFIYFIFSKAFRAQLRRPHSKKARRHSEGQPKATNNEALPSTLTSTALNHQSGGRSLCRRRFKGLAAM